MQVFADCIMGENVNLTWQNFSHHREKIFKNLMETQRFTDVTLISDDQHQYRVHKFILRTCSFALRKILANNPLTTSIYLMGIHHKELESILQFIYLGEATLYHERMKEFLNAAKDLDLMDVSKNIVKKDNESKDSFELKLATQYHEEKKEFLNVAKDIDLEDISKNIVKKG